MVLHLTPTTTIGDLQNAFVNAFPLLKIEFFSSGHSINEASPAKQQIKQPSMTLGQIVPTLSAGTLQLDKQTTVQAFEQEMEAQFGLHVQVFRKSGNLYLETTVSDHLTLAEQQARAAASERPAHTSEEHLDYREQD